jgi:hypothetical protein
MLGKAAELGSTHKADWKSWKDYLEYFCYRFLSRKEISSIMADKDKHIHWDDEDLKTRIKRHFKRQEV